MFDRILIAAAITTAATLAVPVKPAVTAEAPSDRAVQVAALPRPSASPVYTVDAVTFEVKEQGPRKIVIKARGTVRTGGWANPQLVPLQMRAAETDQLSFTFVAQGPAADTFVTQMITPIEATLTLYSVAGTVKAIRIVSETNELTQALP